MRKFRTGDGYTFVEQPDGTLTDNINPELADQTYTNLAELQAAVDVKEITEEVGE
jgi:hypothetical protein